MTMLAAMAADQQTPVLDLSMDPADLTAALVDVESVSDHEGPLADGCVTCPWHGSVFRLADGEIVRGPSAYPQPRWETRIRDGVIELKPA